MSTFFAPGRVNLIGEHTDYNGGFVFPCALDMGTTLTITSNSDRVLRFRSANMPEVVEVPIDEAFQPLPNRLWANYPLGCIALLSEKIGGLPCGYDMVFEGNVPQGAGLSSSASIEVVTAFAFNELLHAGLTRTQIAQLAQECEHRYAGVKCGIMDQFVSSWGKANHAIYLNCETLEFDYVPVRMDGISIVLTNSHSPHKLDAGTYNERVRECEQAVAMISKKLPIRRLAELTTDAFNKVEHTLTDPTIHRRARHVVSECERTRQAVRALQSGDIVTFGQLMNASHCSLRDDYEVTGHNLDLLAETAWQVEGVLGSRMTGGGFGGCTVSLVRNEHIPAFRRIVGQRYKDETGIDAEFYVAKIGNGVSEIQG